MLFQRSTIITASVLTMSVLGGLLTGARSAGPHAGHGSSGSACNFPAMQPSRTGHGEEAPRTVTGTVVETMNAANYTVRAREDGQGGTRAATAQFEVKVGERVTVPLEMAMENFHSQTLNRDFPSIYFVSQIARDGASPHRTQPASAADSPPVTTPCSHRRAAPPSRTSGQTARRSPAGRSRSAAR